MGISDMMKISYVFAMIAALSGAAAVVMFFAYDIRECWRILRGGRGFSRGHALRGFSRKRGDSRKSRDSQGEKTAKLDAGFEAKEHEPALLLDEYDTVPLGAMEMIQDITMTQTENPYT